MSLKKIWNVCLCLRECESYILLHLFRYGKIRFCTRIRLSLTCSKLLYNQETCSERTILKVLLIYGAAFASLFSTGEEKIVQLLIDRGANINARNEYNDTALIHAANLGNIHLFLIVLFQDIRLTYYWCLLGYEPTVQVLIERGADVNVTNTLGNSALLLAAVKGQNRFRFQLAIANWT